MFNGILKNKKLTYFSIADDIAFIESEYSVVCLKTLVPCAPRQDNTASLPSRIGTSDSSLNTSPLMTSSFSCLLYRIILLAPWAGKMNRISRCDWLPERARWSYLARSGYGLCPARKIYHVLCVFKIKMSDRNFTQRFDVFMTSLSSDNKITVQQCYICGERCDYSLT